MLFLVGEEGELIFQPACCPVLQSVYAPPIFRCAHALKCKVPISREFAACVRRSEMVEEQLRKLSAKRSLDGGDAFALIQLLQEQTTPILSLRSAGSSNAPSSDRRPAANAVDEDRGRIEGRRAREPPETGKGGAASRGVSPKRALFGGRSGSATVLDVNSLEEFPPMQPSVNTTCRLMKLIYT